MLYLLIIFQGGAISAKVEIVARMLSAAQSAVAVVAIIVGGIWSYFRFVKGHTFHPRLEAIVTGKVATIDEVTYLLVSLKLKNPGASMVRLRREGSALDIHYDRGQGLETHPLSSEDLASMPWGQPKSVDVFEGHHWIEANEVIEDSKLIAISAAGHVAVKLRLVVETARTVSIATTVVLIR